MKKVALVFISVGFFLTFLGTASASKNEPVTLAIVAEMSGKAAALGENWEPGVKLAIQQINEAGGIVGHHVTSFTVDTEGKPTKAASAIRYALSKDPFAVIGPVISSSILAVIPLTEKAGVPEIVGGIADAVTEQGDKYVLRANPGASAQSKVVAKFLAENIGAKKVAIVFRNDARGQSAEAALEKYLSPLNVATVAVPVSTDQADFSGVAAQIAKSGADTVYLSALAIQDAQIILAIDDAGIRDQVKITGDQNALSSTTSELTKGASDGIRGVVDYSPGAKGFKELAQRFASKHDGRAPTAEFYKSYIFTWLLKYAADDVGSLDQEKIMDYIHGRTFCVDEYPHLLQSFYIDETGEPDGRTYVTKVVNQEQVVSGFVKPLEEDKFTGCQ